MGTTSPQNRRFLPFNQFFHILKHKKMNTLEVNIRCGSNPVIPTQKAKGVRSESYPLFISVQSIKTPSERLVEIEGLPPLRSVKIPFLGRQPSFYVTSSPHGRSSLFIYIMVSIKIHEQSLSSGVSILLAQMFMSIHLFSKILKPHFGILLHQFRAVSVDLCE